MSKKNILDSVQVPVPCDEDWDNMIGDNRKRFCLGCEKDVYNLSAMSRRQAGKFASKNAGKVCVRYSRLPDGRVLTTDRILHQIFQRKSLVAAGVLAASVTFSGLAHAQNNATPSKNGLSKTVDSKNRDSKTSQISFTITDPLDNIIPDSEVSLTNQKTKQEFKALTGQDGIAHFSLLPHGRYEVAASAMHFQSYKSFIQIKEIVEPNIDIRLEVGVVIGVISIDWSEIPLFQAIAQNDNDVVKKLINSGFDVNTRASDNKTALHVAVVHGNLDMVRFLLGHGAKVNIKTRDKRTPILMVGGDDEQTSIEIFKLLIAKGADVNAQDDEKKTLLMRACEDEAIDGVKLLLNAGANPNLKDEDGETAYDKTDSDEIKQLLIKFGARPRKKS